MMIRIAWLLLLLPFPALAQSTVNKAQLRTQSRPATERQLKDQLWSIFEPVDERRRKDAPAPQRPFRATSLTSHPYAVQVPVLGKANIVQSIVLKQMLVFGEELID